MANHKRGKPKDSRAGCKLCKPHKSNSQKDRAESQTMQERKALQEDGELNVALDTWEEDRSYDGQKDEVDDALAFGRAWSAVNEFFEDQYPDLYEALIKTALWFNTPNPLLGDVSPMSMRDTGRSHVLWKFVKQSLAENSLS